jgi:hypothetical protein
MQRLISNPSGVRAVRSPSPRPSPLGRGRIVVLVLVNRRVLVNSTYDSWYSLSLGERVTVRGNSPSGLPSLPVDI